MLATTDALSRALAHRVPSHAKPPQEPTPFGIANSWSIIMYAGELRKLHYLGRELMLFWGESGRAAVLGAYRPHLGAHVIDSQGSTWRPKLEP